MKKIIEWLKNLFKGYNNGLADGYIIGVDVANQEHNAKSKLEITVVHDFFMFKNELINQYGSEYVKQTELVIKNFPDFNHGLPPYTLTNTNITKQLSKYMDKDYHIIHFLKMITAKLLEEDTEDAIVKARTYCKIGMNLLSPDICYHNFHTTIFKEYKNRLQAIDWEND